MQKTIRHMVICIDRKSTKLPGLISKRDANKLLFVLKGRPGSDHSSNRSYRMTFEEQRAIQEEVRNTGVAEAGGKVQALHDEKAADKGIAVVRPPVPGRDSGFCSEQDQLAQQTQGEKKHSRSCAFVVVFIKANQNFFCSDQVLPLGTSAFRIFCGRETRSTLFLLCIDFITDCIVVKRHERRNNPVK